MVEDGNEKQGDNELAIATRCSFIRPDGNQCEANRVKDSEFCFFHDPCLSKERAEARRRGGLNKYARGEPGNYIIESPRDILGVLVDALNQSTALPNTAGRAKAIGYLVSVILKSFEVSEIESRLAALEQKVFHR